MPGKGLSTSLFAVHCRYIAALAAAASIVADNVIITSQQVGSILFNTVVTFPPASSLAAATSMKGQLLNSPADVFTASDTTFISDYGPVSSSSFSTAWVAGSTYITVSSSTSNSTTTAPSTTTSPTNGGSASPETSPSPPPPPPDVRLQMSVCLHRASTALCMQPSSCVKPKAGFVSGTSTRIHVVVRWGSASLPCLL